MDKLWHIQVIEYSTALKRNASSSHEKTQRNLKCLLLSDNKESEKAKCCMIPTLGHSEKAKLWRQEEDQSLPGETGGGSGEEGMNGGLSRQ